jgi:hypothetical protein
VPIGSAHLSDPRITCVGRTILSSETDIRFTFLPLYSPNFNSVEKACGRPKVMLREAGARTICGLWNLIGTLVDLF